MSKALFVKRKYLTEGQRHLYALICVKGAGSDKITFEEAREIYINFVNRTFIEGKPYKWNYWANQVKREDGTYTYTPKLEPMTDDEIDNNTSNWLIQNLGRLVLKGLLSVIPQVELKRLESKEFS